MSSATYFVLALPLLFGVVISLPISSDSEKSYIAPEKAFVHGSEGNSSPADNQREVETERKLHTEDVAMGLGLESFKLLKRSKRHIIFHDDCPEGMLRLKRWCVTFEQYERILDEEKK